MTRRIAVNCYPNVRMLAAERRYERAADQVVRCVSCVISEQLLTGEI
jgi:hypothetical protein